jgi:steroid 5-alpha reductase family enzyme
MKYFTPLLPFIAGWTLLLITDSFAVIGLYNGLLQLVLFGLVVCIPIWKTHRMSYVDIGWPLGLMLIGALTWFLSSGDPLRTALVSVVYLSVGGRMGFGALKLWSMGRLKQEFPRYEYQKQRWIASGKPIHNWRCKLMPSGKDSLTRPF